MRRNWIKGLGGLCLFLSSVAAARCDRELLRYSFSGPTFFESETPQPGLVREWIEWAGHFKILVRLKVNPGVNMDEAEDVIGSVRLKMAKGKDVEVVEITQMGNLRLHEVSLDRIRMLGLAPSYHTLELATLSGSNRISFDYLFDQWIFGRHLSMLASERPYPGTRSGQSLCHVRYNDGNAAFKMLVIQEKGRVSHLAFSEGEYPNFLKVVPAADRQHIFVEHPEYWRSEFFHPTLVHADVTGDPVRARAWVDFFEKISLTSQTTLVPPPGQIGDRTVEGSLGFADEGVEIIRRHLPTVTAPISRVRTIQLTPKIVTLKFADDPKRVTLLDIQQGRWWFNRPIPPEDIRVKLTPLPGSDQHLGVLRYIHNGEELRFGVMVEKNVLTHLLLSEKDLTLFFNRIVGARYMIERTFEKFTP